MNVYIYVHTCIHMYIYLYTQIYTYVHVYTCMYMNLNIYIIVHIQEEEEEAAPPPLAVPLPNKASYYLLDDFNHHHQHSVLAGKTDRFASTHRVCRTDGHTFSSIKHRCIAAMQGKIFTCTYFYADWYYIYHFYVLLLMPV
jgi:hypothetical protein